MLIQAQAIEHFENQLDIRSIVKTKIDLSILLSLLLNKEQLHLFRNQHARSFVSYNSAKKNLKLKPFDEPFVRLLDPNFIHLAKRDIQ